MRILITGGAGFLGSSLSRHLIGKRPEYRITALDSLVSGGLDNLGEDVLDNRNFSFWEGDILDGKAVDNLVRNSDVVVHMASLTDAGGAESAPFIDANIRGTAVLMESARRAPPIKFIHVSAPDVYGASRTPPLTEEHQLAPRTIYGASKAAADMLALSFFASHGVPAVILRPFNVYGPRQGPEHIIPSIITRAIDEKPVPIPGDGNSTGDWMFVEDFCRAVDKTIRTDSAQIAGEVINLGTGREKSMNEVAGAILGLLGKSESLITFVEEKSAPAGHAVSSVSKAELLLEWEAAVDFERGIRITADWYMENQEWWRGKNRGENR